MTISTETSTLSIEELFSIKGWSRAKKEKMITEFNPEWRFMNDDL